MKRAAVPLLLLVALSAGAFAEDPESTSTPEKRSWFGRFFHRREELTEYKDARLNGLVLSVDLSPQPIRLSEVRQMDVRVTLTNKSRRPIPLEFPTAQRFEIYLLNSGEKILTTWSDNHAFADTASNVMINPQEHIDYAETIATRELTPNKVFICEVFFPKYPDLRVRQKFLTAP